MPAVHHIPIIVELLCFQKIRASTKSSAYVYSSLSSSLDVTAVQLKF
jgi:hypothetical protein